MIKKVLYIVVFLSALLCGASLRSQEPDRELSPGAESDSSRAVPSFRPDAGMSVDALKRNFIREYNYGFFPKKITNVFAVSLMMSVGNFYGGGSGIQSQAFGELSPSYTWKSQFDRGDDEHLILKEGEFDKNERYYPTKSYGRVGFDFHYMSKLPLGLKANLSWLYDNNNMLYSKDKSKHFLGSDGKKNNVKEVDVLFFDEAGISMSLGTIIDIWGGSMDNGMMASYSHYYLELGYMHDFFYKSKATRFRQLATDNKRVLYDNLQDTLRIFDEKELSNIDKSRGYWQIGIGSYIGAQANVPSGTKTTPNGALFTWSLLASVPNESMFTDTKYKSIIVSFNFSIGLSLHIKN